MDKLDFGILKLLLAANGTPPGAPQLRKSFRSMAKDLGVDEGTVRARFRKFQEQRVLKGWYLGVSPGVSGRSVIQAWLIVEPESNKEEFIRRVLALADVERVCNYLGPKLSLVLLYSGGKNPNLALQHLEATTGLEGWRKQAVIEVPPRKLRETDAAIVNLLRADPWRPYSEVARELGLSSRTVKRRVTSLAEDGTIRMLPIIDLKALQGIVPMELVVEYASPESRTTVNGLVMSRVKDYLVFSDVSGPHGYFALAVPNLSQVERIADWVRQQRGVRDAQFGALQDVILNQKHYEKLPRVKPKPEREEILA